VSACPDRASSVLTAHRFAPKAAKGAFPSTDAESFAIQEYHFIKGQVLFSYNFTDRREVTTVNGKNLTFYVAPNGTRYVNDAMIVDSDYLISTGVFHVIDTALDPRIEDAKPSYLNATDSSSTGQPASSSSGGLSSGAKAGIGVSVTIVVLAIIGIIAFFLLRRRRKPTGPPSELPATATKAGGWREMHQMSDDKHPQEMQGANSVHEIHSEGRSGRGEMEGSSEGARSRYGGSQPYEMQ
jgi:hypothetical protein